MTLQKMNLQIQIISAELVTVQNLGEGILPILFFVGPQNYSINWIGQLTRLLQGDR